MNKKELKEYFDFCKDNNIYRIASVIYTTKKKYIDEVPLDMMKSITLSLSNKLKEYYKSNNKNE